MDGGQRVTAYERGQALWEAVQDNDASAVRAALHGATPRDAGRACELVCGPDGVTPLHVATLYPPLLALLLEAGADPNAGSCCQHVNPLYVASADGQVESVRALLAAGADVESVTNTSQAATALHVACQKGCWEVALALLAARADPRARTGAGKTPAVIACEGGHLRLAQHLHRIVPATVHTVSGKGLTALHLAASGHHLECVRWLLDLGLDVNAATRPGLTPIMFALSDAHLGCCQLLLRRGADPNVKCELYPYYPLAMCTSNRVAASLLIAGARATEYGKALAESLCIDALCGFTQDLRDHVAATLPGRYASQARQLSRLPPLLVAARSNIPEYVLRALDTADPWAFPPGQVPFKYAPCGSRSEELLKECRRPWAPQRHHLFTRQHRDRVRLLLTLARHLQDEWAGWWAGTDGQAEPALAHLPFELWLKVLSHTRRRDAFPPAASEEGGEGGEEEEEEASFLVSGLFL